MDFITDYRLERFILNTRWEDLPPDVGQRLRGCLLDLLGALISGSGSRQFAVGLALARSAFRWGNVAVLGAPDRLNLLGAAAAMGHAANAYDIDDGHNIIRAHPGASFIAGVLAAGYDADTAAADFLTALYVSYETTVRMGRAIMDYYGFPHSSGTFGAVGVAAGMGRLCSLNERELNNVLSVAEFNAPLVPGIRSVTYPAMNKDGVPFGVMTGVLALLDGRCGFTGNRHLLEAETYRHNLDDLGEKHEVMALYFKPYPCCRWAHPAIDACLELLRTRQVAAADIESVTVETFYRATLLSRGIPSCADEAQYNIAYPVASAIVNNGFSIRQVERTEDPAVHAMMKKLRFVCDREMDEQFPERRLCRVTMELTDGRRVTSGLHEPTGEAHEKIGYDWLAEKFRRVTEGRLLPRQQTAVIELLRGDGWTVRGLVDSINGFLL